jgi:hypothetical protein
MNEIIAVIKDAFIVLCGVAISQFFTGGTVVDHDPAFRTPGDPRTPERKGAYVLSYTLALIIIVTLSLRFLIGSHVQMTHEYGQQVARRRFVTDVCFLMFFGAFLVGVAQAKSVRAFMGWLAGISAAGVVWSIIAFKRSPLAPWWLGVNTGQLVLAVVLATVLSRWCQPVNAPLAASRKRAVWSLVLAGLWFIIIFFFDLQKMIPGKTDLDL